MPGSILASATSDNAPGGAVLTFAFPVILFAVIAVILYLLFSRPHRRIPSRRVVVASASAAPPGPGTAHSAAVPAGSATEPAGARRDTATGNVSGEARESAEAGGSEDGTTEGTEASE